MSSKAAQYSTFFPGNAANGGRREFRNIAHKLAKRDPDPHITMMEKFMICFMTSCTILLNTTVTTLDTDQGQRIHKSPNLTAVPA